MKYSSYSTRLLKRDRGSLWQARLKYKDPITNKWKETSKMLPEAKGKREANKLALEWFNSMNEAASLAPEGSKEEDKTISEVVKAYENEEDYLNNKPVDRKDYERAVGARKEELNKQK